MRAIIYVFCLMMLIMACGPAGDKDATAVPAKELSLPQMLQRKNEIDMEAGRGITNYTLFAKVKGRAALVPVTDNQWPENMEYNYNILKDSTGKVIMISAQPFSESGAWFVSFTHCFTADGKTFAFERMGNSFNLPDDEVAFETTVDYYNPQFKSIKHTYTLVDKNKKALDKKYAFDFASLAYKTYPDLEAVLRAYNIKP